MHKNKVVGIVTLSDLNKAAPSAATSLAYMRSIIY